MRELYDIKSGHENFDRMQLIGYESHGFLSGFDRFLYNSYLNGLTYLNFCLSISRNVCHMFFRIQRP